jgi:hypothetical protein
MGELKDQIPGKTSQSGLKGWAALTLALAWLVLFIYVIGPAGL